MISAPNASRLLSAAGWLAALLPVGLVTGHAAAEIVAGLLVILFILHTLIHHKWSVLLTLGRVMAEIDVRGTSK